MTKITIIHGQAHKGSTYHITQKIIHKLSYANKEVYEYFMPIDTPDYCVGCYQCFDVSENACPHAKKVQAIVTSIKASDIIILNSPTYCYGMTGQLKTLLDHLGYMWLPHRPQQAMFHKVGIVVSTASGAGATKVTKALKQQMFWLGISNVFKYSKNVSASSWETVPDNIKKAIERDIAKFTVKVKSKTKNARPSFKLKFMFMMMRMMQKSNDWNQVDKAYWESNGWLGKKRPWITKYIQKTE